MLIFCKLLSVTRILSNNLHQPNHKPIKRNKPGQFRPTKVWLDTDINECNKAVYSSQEINQIQNQIK